MADEPTTTATRIPTDDLPGLGGGRREIRVSISVVIGFIMMAVGVATFASNFVFATKQELSEQTVDRVRSESIVLRDLTSIRESVRNLELDFELHEQDAKRRHEHLDQNLRRLMIRRGVRPVEKPAEEAAEAGED